MTTATRTKKTSLGAAKLAKAAQSAPTALPTIGSDYEGGIYAGIARGENGEKDHHLVVLEAAPGRLTWKSAVAWAEKIGASLPTRREQAVLYGNVPELFEAAAYWSSTPYAGFVDSAWCAYFTNGAQFTCHKAGGLRARAVRRLPI